MFIRLLMVSVCLGSWVCVVAGVGGPVMFFVAGIMTVATLLTLAGVADE